MSTTNYSPALALLSGVGGALGFFAVFPARPILAPVAGFVFGVLFHQTLARVL